MKLKEPHLILRAIIDQKMIKQSALAKRLKFPPTQLSETLHGKRKISAKLAFRLQDVLGIDGEKLLRDQFEFEIREFKKLRK